MNTEITKKISSIILLKGKVLRGMEPNEWNQANQLKH